MKLLFNQPHLSIAQSDQPVEVSDFAILTGLNGSGKTHLLRAIQQGKVLIEEIGKLNPKAPVIAFFGPTGLTKRDETQANVSTSHTTSHVTPVTDPPPLVQEGISSIFWNYYSKKEANQYNLFRNQQDGRNRTTLDEAEFLAAHGPKPWDTLNNILENHFNLPYRVNSPEMPDFFGKRPPLERNQPYLAHMFHVEKKIGMPFSFLSSGEQVMMALVTAIYKATLKGSRFPKVLLLDESDAVLHPSMIQKMLEVIQHYFVKEQGMKVLMATHSPSTVAYAPEESIYIVNPSSKEPRVEKQDKQTALSILTEGVVSCFFDPNARLQIRHSIQTKRKPLLLVEGFTDALIIQKAWEKIRESEIPFDIKDCFGAGLLRATLQNANDIVGKGEGAKVFGLFDYDAAGFGNWIALKANNWTDISTKEIQAKKSQEHEWHALLLPIPKHLATQAGENHGKESRLEIEHLLSGHPKGEGFFVEEEVVGGGKIIAFHGDKQKFAEQAILDFPKEAFGDFEPLFRFIEEQINLPDNMDG